MSPSRRSTSEHALDSGQGLENEPCGGVDRQGRKDSGRKGEHRVEVVEQGYLSPTIDFLLGIMSITSGISRNNRHCRPYKLLF